MFLFTKAAFGVYLWLYSQSLLLFDIPSLTAYWIMLHSTICMRWWPRYPQLCSLSNQTAFLTGVSGGIGKQLAILLCKLGVKTLWVTARSMEQGQILAREIEAEAKCQGVVKIVILDQGSMENISDFRTQAKEVFKQEKVDFVILNAGIWSLKPSPGPDLWDASFQINTVAPMALALIMLQYMSNGGVLNLAGSSMEFLISAEEVQRRLKRMTIDIATFGPNQYEFTKFVQQDVARWLCRRVQNNITISSACVGYTNTPLYRTDPYAGHPLSLKYIAADPRVSCNTVVEAMQRGSELHGKLFKDGRIVSYVDHHHAQDEETRWQVFEEIIRKAIHPFVENAVELGSITRQPSLLPYNRPSPNYGRLIVQLIGSGFAICLIGSRSSQVLLGLLSLGICSIWNLR